MSSSKPSKRLSHRKHLSTRRSSDTSTLPEYIPSPGWNHHTSRQLVEPTETDHLGRQQDEDLIWDKPPDYPDSAEEADEDTDDSDTNLPQLNLTPSVSPRVYNPTSPNRRSKRFLPPPPLTPTHKRRQSSQTHILRSSKSLSHHKPRQLSERLLLSPADPAVSDSKDPYLDSLLERSVHALEMSNTLLQSSISTQTSLNAILTGGDGEGSERETLLETRAINLHSRIQDDWGARAAWADDLEEISKDVEGLFGGSGTATITSPVPTPSTTTEGGSVSDAKHGVGMGVSIKKSSSHRRDGSTASGMSCSLPTTNTLSSASMTWNRRRPSLDLKEVVADKMTTCGLHFAQQSRENLISPPPRPITQYAPSIQLSDELVLPSTIGVRSPPSIYQAPQWKSVSELASSSTTSLLTIPVLPTTSLPPKLTDRPLEPSTPAYNMLSSFVNRQPSSGSNTPSTSITTSFMANLRRTSSLTKRRSSSTSPSPSLRDRTLRPPHREPISQRRMTPPAEESYSSSDSCMAKRTVQCLRKILDEQPPPVARTAALGLTGDGMKAPKFMPRTPAPIPEASTSNATASISRLFTKGTHSSSTRAPSPPRQSAMKHSRNNSSAPPTPTSMLPLPSLLQPSSNLPSPSPSTFSIPEMVSKALNGHTSASSSGRSTPNKHISFAELPESYASTRPGGAGSSKFKEKHSRGKRKGTLSSSSSSLTTTTSGNGAGGNSGSGTSSDGGLGFSTARWWLGGGVGNAGLGGLSMSLARHEERMEDRITRSWGGRMGAGLFSSGLDEWAA